MLTMRSTVLALARLGLVIAACLSSGLAIAGPTRYTFTNLGIPPGDDIYTSLIDMNNLGQVIGITFGGTDADPGYFYDGSQMTRIPKGDRISAYPTGINDKGEISFDRVQEDFYAKGINNSGMMVGSNGHQAAVLANGVTTPVGALDPGQISYGTAINDGGIAVGAIVDNGHYYPAMFSGDQTVRLELPAGAKEGIANSVNNLGMIVGRTIDENVPYSPDGHLTTLMHGFLCSDGKVTDLGSLGGANLSAALDINNKGQIVGWSTVDDKSFMIHAMIYQDGTMHDLTHLVDGLPDDLILKEAVAINDRGQILASASDANNASAHYSILLNPVSTPEPSSLLVFAALGCAGWFLRRQAASPNGGSTPPGPVDPSRAFACGGRGSSR